MAKKIKVGPNVQSENSNTSIDLERSPKTVARSGRMNSKETKLALPREGWKRFLPILALLIGVLSIISFALGLIGASADGRVSLAKWLTELTLFTFGLSLILGFIADRIRPEGIRKRIFGMVSKGLMIITLALLVLYVAFFS